MRIVSGDFAGLRTLQRHQLVYRSLGALMQTDIHALSIDGADAGRSALITVNRPTGRSNQRNS